MSPPLAQLEARTEHFQDYLDHAVGRGREAAAAGRVSTQIPALGLVPEGKFGMAVATVQGAVFTAADGEEPFCIQSISKLFALCALLRHQPQVWEHVGWRPSDSGYGSVAELERNQGSPNNPFVNPGALVVTDRLIATTGNAAEATTELMKEASGDWMVASDPSVALSETVADHRNTAIAHVLAEHGKLRNGVDDVLGQYFAQCSLTASAATLARAALFLARPPAGRHLLGIDSIRKVNAVLLMSGMYGAAGEIAYRIGLPAKSGIGGGILAVMPGLGTVCAWSPPLDEAGNSAGGVVAIEHFAHLAGWTVF